MNENELPIPRITIREYLRMIPNDAWVILARGQYGDFPGPKTFWADYACELPGEDEIPDETIRQIIPCVVYNHVYRGNQLIPAAAATMIVI